jgi:hypothetical protein
MKTARRRMIGSGMPISQSSAPLPKPMSASCMMESYALTGRRFQLGNCGKQKSLKPTIGCAVESFQARDSILFGRFLFKVAYPTGWIGNWSCDAVAKFPGIGHSVDAA